MLRNTHTFFSNERGATLVEFAFIAPIMMMATLGTVEFGSYFLKSQSNNRAVNITSNAIMNAPGDASNQELMKVNMANYDDQRNYGCAVSYSTLAQAENGDCGYGHWQTTEPADLPDEQDHYFVLLKSNVVSESFTGLFDGVVPNNTVRQVVKLYENSGNDHLCNGEELRDRVCFYGIERRGFGGGGNHHSLGSDKDYTYAPLVWSSSRKVKFDQPICTPAGWGCGGIANAFFQAHENSNPVNSYGHQNGNRYSTLGPELISSKSLKEEHLECSSAATHRKEKSYGWKCYTGK